MSEPSENNAKEEKSINEAQNKINNEWLIQSTVLNYYIREKQIQNVSEHKEEQKKVEEKKEISVSLVQRLRELDKAEIPKNKIYFINGNPIKPTQSDVKRKNKKKNIKEIEEDIKISLLKANNSKVKELPDNLDNFIIRKNEEKAKKIEKINPRKPKPFNYLQNAKKKTLNFIEDFKDLIN